MRRSHNAAAPTTLIFRHTLPGHGATTTIANQVPNEP